MQRKQIILNFPFFIARRIAGVRQSSFSGLIIKIATVAVALSLAVMLISTAFVTGFRKEISKRVFGFDGHIKVRSFDANRSFEDKVPISLDKSFYKKIQSLEGVQHVQSFAHKIGVLKNEEIIEGIILKGVASDFDWESFQPYIKEGSPFEVVDSTKTKAILLSDYTAKRLKAKIGDDLLAYFVEERVRYRKFELVGIYKTGLEEYDERFALIDIGHIQKLNKWEKNEVGGVSVILDNYEMMDTINDKIYYSVLDHETKSNTIREINPGIFDWLELQGTNEFIILTLMIIVAIINMITALLILILERTNMIGILKALGANNQSIRRIFLYKAARIIGIGMLIGNLIGIGVCFLQYYFQIIKLDEASYYLSYAPVDFNWWSIILINIGVFVISLLALIVPSYLVSWITPIKAIRFD